MTSADQKQLDHIAQLFAAEIRSGQSPHVSEWVDRYPGLGDRLRSLLESVSMIERIKRQTEPDGRGFCPTIEQLDDYKILREVGHGGMGVVFEAIHQSLGRRVAIKVLSPGVIGQSKQLARFRREARAAAQLRHPNIVPVFGAGECGGHHYYVMDLIDGISVRDWIRSIGNNDSLNPSTVDVAKSNTNLDTLNDQTLVTKSDPKIHLTATSPERESAEYYTWVASRAAVICDALQYAHRSGVLHRDVKPANVLINKKGDVWIADFGLAKLMEGREQDDGDDSVAHSHAITMTGDVVGTPQYMPPESFDGDYDVRSEVYGVGLTLYEMLTLQPAISGRNTADVIRKATEGGITPPRRVVPGLPRDLNTIVMKAIERDPARRYDSAAAMRDDLQRFLGDRPISARRTGVVERAVLWTRRQPVVASLTFATFFLLVALASVSAVGYLRTQGLLQERTQALSTADTALATVEVERNRAENNLQVALDAFDQIMRNVTERGIGTDAEFVGEMTDTTSPDVSPDDARLLESLLGFFDKLADNNNKSLRAESAAAARRAGEIYQRLGRLREADQAFTSARNRYAKLSADTPDNVDYVVAQADIMNKLAVTTSLRGRLSRATELFEDTESLLLNSPEALESENGQFEWAHSHRLFASLRARSGLDFRPPRRQPAPRQRMRVANEMEAVDVAIEALKSLSEESPENLQYRAELARAHRDKARIVSQMRRPQQSQNSIRAAIAGFESLLQEKPDSSAIRYELAVTLSSREAMLSDGMVRAQRAHHLSGDLMKTSASLPRYRALRAHTLGVLASQYRRRRRPMIAERHLRDSISIYSNLVEQAPELRVYQTRRARALESLADLKWDQGDKQASVEALQRGIRQLQPGVRRKGSSTASAMQLKRMQSKLKRFQTAIADNAPKGKKTPKDNVESQVSAKR